MQKQKRVGLWVYISVILLCLFCFFPFAWMLISSFKLVRELYTVPPTWWPKEPTLNNYIKVLFRSNIPRYFINSTIISAGSTVVALIFAIFAGYGFSRFRFRGSRFYQLGVLASQMLPTAVLVVPIFVTLRALGLVNTYGGLILTYLILTLPLCVWMMTGYFRTIPYELEEAAQIDGCSRLGILFRILVPLSLPGIVATATYAFVVTWNEFIFALSLATDSRVMTLPIGLAEFATEFNTDWGAVMAASVIMTVPIAILFLFLQKLFIEGLTAGATKG